MAKEKIKRLILEIKRLRKYPASMKEMHAFLGEQSDFEGCDYRISDKTFGLDIKEISDLFSIDIEYDYSMKAYKIVQDHHDEIGERIVEAFDIFSALNIKERLNNCIHLEKRRSSGTEYLYPALMAIKEQREVAFQYEKFDDAQQFTERRIQPYGIKEFRNWWFLLGKDLKDGKLKNFGLDRIRNLQATKKKFEKDADFDINEYYQHSFGVTVLHDKEPQELILAITGEEINYVKTMPFHSSQEIIEDTGNRLLIKLQLYITWELVAELRSKGPYIEVISPQELKNKLADYKYLDQF